MNQFTKAVNYLSEYVDATDNVFEDGTLPNIETGVAYALKILRSHQDYDGPNLPN
jgi:hypothetical protein